MVIDDKGIPAIVGLLGSLLRKRSVSFCPDPYEEPEDSYFTIVFYSARYKNKSNEAEAVRGTIPIVREKAQKNFLHFFEPQLSNIDPHNPSVVDLALYDARQEGLKIIEDRLSENSMEGRYTFTKLLEVFDELGKDLINMYSSKYEKRLIDAGYIPDSSKAPYDSYFGIL